MTIFPIGQNNVSTKVGPAGYTAGSGSLVLISGGGGGFPVLPAGQYLKVSVLPAAQAYLPSISSTSYTIFKVTGISGDTLTLAGSLEGTSDQNFAANDVVEMRATAGYW